MIRLIASVTANPSTDARRKSQLRQPSSTAVPYLHDLDHRSCFIDLEVDVTTGLPQEQPLELRVLLGRERRARAPGGLKKLDHVEELTREQARSVGMVAPSHRDSLRRPHGAVRNERFHDLAARRTAKVRASSNSPRANCSRLSSTA